MKKNKWIAALSAAVLCVSLAGAGIAWKVFGDEEQMVQKSASEQMESTQDIVELAKKAVSDVQYPDEVKSVDTKITLKGTTATCDGEGASFKDGVLMISKEGSYEISGTLTDGRIEVEADKDSKIEIVLNGVDVTCSNYAPFTVWQADKTLICLAEGTTNSFTDGGDYYEEESTEEKMPSAAFYSKDDLEFAGKGTLNIYASCNDGLTGKDDISFAGGTYVIEATKDAIVGKDSVAIKDGAFTITAGKHGIKSSKEEDEEKGFVAIMGGTFDIHAEVDGLHAASYAWIEDGTFTINSQDDGIHADSLVHICGGEVVVESSYEGIEAAYVCIKDGSIHVTASDDGINAADGQSAEGGMQDVGQRGMMPGDGNEPTEDGNRPDRGGKDSFGEGNEPPMEGNGPSRNGKDSFGDGNGPSMDDKDSFGGGKKPGGGGMEQDAGSSDCMILIEGGEIYVNADGDGIDSNGSIYVSGGTITVDGPVNDGNGIFDYGGEFVVTGGNLIGAGSSGMLQSISENSEQSGLAVVFSETQRAGTKIVIKDSEGTEIAAYTPEKTFSAVVVSTPEFEIGNSYSVYLDDNLYTEVEMDSVSTAVGNMQKGGGMGGERREQRKDFKDRDSI